MKKNLKMPKPSRLVPTAADRVYKRWIESFFDTRLWGDGQPLVRERINQHLTGKSEYKLPPLSMDRVIVHRRGERAGIELLTKRNPSKPSIALSIRASGTDGQRFLDELNADFFEKRLYSERSRSGAMAYLVIEFYRFGFGPRPSRDRTNQIVIDLEAALRTRAHLSGLNVKIEVRGTYSRVEKNEYGRSFMKPGRWIRAPRCRLDSDVDSLVHSVIGDGLIIRFIAGVRRTDSSLFWQFQRGRKQKRPENHSRICAIQCGREAIAEFLPCHMRRGEGVSAIMLASLEATRAATLA